MGDYSSAPPRLLLTVEELCMWALENVEKESGSALKELLIWWGGEKSPVEVHVSLRNEKPISQGMYIFVS
jgi:hypothetical protein